MWSPIDAWYGDDVPEPQQVVKWEQPAKQESAFNNSGWGILVKI
jgi:hypothetical protein